MQFLRMSWINFKGQRAAFNLEEFLLLETMYPFLTLVFYCVMAGYAYQTTNLTDWVLGNAFLLCTNICVFSLGTSFVGERYFGRIRSIMVGEKSKIMIVLEKGFIAGLVSMLTTFTGLLLGCLVFGIELKKMPLLELLVILVIAMFAATGFGMFLSAIGLVSDQMHLILNMVQYILLIFTGANFPISQLPIAVRWISWMLPLSRSIQVSREVVKGSTLLSHWGMLVAELLVGVCYLVLAAGLMKWAERKAIKKGTMDLF